MGKNGSSGTLVRKSNKTSIEEFLWKARKIGGRGLFSSGEHCRRPALVQHEQRDGHDGDTTLKQQTS